MSDRPVHHYYHVYASGDWRTAVDEHFTTAQEAGFDPDILVVGIVGSEHDRDEVIDAIVPYRNFFSIVEAREGWEHLTLDQMYQDATETEFYAVYGHTKGAAYPAEINTYWRRVMDKYTIRDWRNAVKKLEGHFHAVGPFWNQYMEGQTPYFAGNFWWARSEAIAELGKVPDTSRYEAEVWIGRVYSEFGHPIFCNHNSILAVPEFKRAL